MIWIELLGAIGTVLAVAGVVLMNRKRIECFYVWMASNSICLIVHTVAFYGGAATGAMIVRDAIFLILAFEGLWMWSKKAKGKR